MRDRGLKVKPCDEHCHCPACNAEYWSDERERDELAHRSQLAREHMPATDAEWRDYLAMWTGVSCG